MIWNLINPNELMIFFYHLSKLKIKTQIQITSYKKIKIKESNIEKLKGALLQIPDLASLKIDLKTSRQLILFSLLNKLIKNGKKSFFIKDFLFYYKIEQIKERN